MEEDIKILKEMIDSRKRANLPPNVYIKKVELPTLENILNRLENLKVFIAGKKKEISKYSTKTIKKPSVINLLSDIEELLGEEK